MKKNLTNKTFSKAEMKIVEAIEAAQADIIADILEIENQARKSSLYNDFADSKNTHRDKKKASSFEGLPSFKYNNWQSPTLDGGGRAASLRGIFFEKAGVNFSKVGGSFTKSFAKEVRGTDRSSKFNASGISLVIHPRSPKVAAIHMNVRIISTSQTWLAGGIDLNPMTEITTNELEKFKSSLAEICNKYDNSFYPSFSKNCDDYFYIKHRNKQRGAGGIFFDHLNFDDEKNQKFIIELLERFSTVYKQHIDSVKDLAWSEEDERKQLINRGHYAEFNLIYDRGTRFGLQTGGNTEAILMSLPPRCIWP